MDYINDFSEDVFDQKNKYSSAGDGNDCPEYASGDILSAMKNHPELVESIIKDTFEKAHSANSMNYA